MFSLSISFKANNVSARALNHKNLYRFKTEKGSQYQQYSSIHVTEEGQRPKRFTK